MSRIIIFFCFISISQILLSQESFPVNGPRNSSHNYYAFKNANIVKSSGEILQGATLIIRDERIKEVGKDLEIPKNAIVYDLKGKWIYPSFLELDASYGLQKIQSKGNPGYRSPQLESNKKGAYNWNEAIHPEVMAKENFHADPKEAGEYRKMGFGAVLSHEHNGIMRGTSVLVHVGDESDNLMIINETTAQHFSFSKGNSKQSYPSSQMGSIALIRQTLYDEQWYAQTKEKQELNLSLEALINHQDLPVIFECDDYLSALRADVISKEFNKAFILKGNGDEYKRLQLIKATKASFIIPLALPKPYDLSNSYDAIELSLAKMKHWELAPYNARLLHDADVNFAFTTSHINHNDFWKTVNQIQKTGINEADMLDALTIVPAGLIGIDNELGKLENGYLANFIITTDRLFSPESVLMENWVNGKRYVINEQVIDIRGEYNLNVNKNSDLQLMVKGTLMDPKASISRGGKNIPVHLKMSGTSISLRYNLDEENEKGTILLSGSINDNDSRIWIGKAQLVDGKWVDWAAIKQQSIKEKDSAKVEETSIPEIPKIIYPLGAFGLESIPTMANVLIKHATVWTNASTGIMENADVCISNGKILAVGQGLTKSSLFGTKEVELIIIEAKGKHLTSGIIDEHSHIAISRGVNEGGQASSAEVRIGDVINCDDINIYRQLAGGVTASQLLHGSANPIGGQSALIKLRWGSGPEAMKINGSDGFIKFALGENVKQSNWGDLARVRYPQSRMGVEQIYYDGFYRAKEYGEMRKIYNSGLQSRNKKNPPIPPKKDLELDALLEILNGKRFITCHSYVQSEINMLMHVADSMGFRINTFTHILEGYKVADKMKTHGVGASTFSDWWAYKFEVNDAIPYNAALMTEMGVVTAINSDDAEMGRRLNQEAAKTHKYGGLSQEEAWKTVTLNPAKLLHLDNRMGSVEVGKDADLVLWSDNPLTLNAKVEKTYVDGICLYDRLFDEEKRKTMDSERARLIQLMLEKKEKNGKGLKVNKEKEELYHCDSMEGDYE